MCPFMHKFVRLPESRRQSEGCEFDPWANLAYGFIKQGQVA